ncbi:hypothetical protein ACVWWI_006394 [Bradyrhizobium sp. USDA 3686]|nr:hypothetical protein [Bradyrhizobium canariense]MBM7488056.1 hypothetical protein [Bradyrhizobium canariense]
MDKDIWPLAPAVAAEILRDTAQSMVERNNYNQIRRDHGSRKDRSP